MGSRYGRNQKRKHRERIVALEHDSEMQKISHNEYKNSTSRAVHVAKRIVEQIRKISPNSVFLEKATIGYDDMYFTTMYGLDHFTTPFEVGEVLECIDISRIKLYDLELFLKKDEIRRMVHFELNLYNPNERPRYSVYDVTKLYSYKISEEGFMNLHVEEIVHSLVECLQKDFKNNG